MIVTHTVSASGHRRIYLGGKASLECWIEPAHDGKAWTFHIDPEPINHVIDESAKREWAICTLMALAHELDVSPDHLRDVPFERIAALHTANPHENRRVPTPLRQVNRSGYMACKPDVDQPARQFRASRTDASREQRK